MNVMMRAVLVAVAAGLCACTPQRTSSSPSAPAKQMSSNTKSGAVIVQDTPYYKNGPAQPMPPDGTLKAGTPVTVGKKIGSYTFVRAADGTQGYVKTSDIAAATAK